MMGQSDFKLSYINASLKVKLRSIIKLVNLLWLKFKKINVNFTMENATVSNDKNENI